MSAIDPAPLQLELTDTERTMMRHLDELIPSPRVTKRFVNTYRLIKGMYPPGQLRRFEGDEHTPGEFQAVMLLLAMQNGFATEASAVFRELARETGHRQAEDLRGVEDPREDDESNWTTWWHLVEAMRPQLDDVTGWSNELVGSLTEVQAERWDRLAGALLAQREHVGIEDVEVYARHAGAVARFGFVTGRVLAPERHDAGQEAGAHRATGAQPTHGSDYGGVDHSAGDV